MWVLAQNWNLLLSFYMNNFGIKWTTMVDMPLNNEAQPKQKY